MAAYTIQWARLKVTTDTADHNTASLHQIMSGHLDQLLDRLQHKFMNATEDLSIVQKETCLLWALHSSDATLSASFVDSFESLVSRHADESPSDIVRARYGRPLRW